MALTVATYGLVRLALSELKEREGCAAGGGREWLGGGGGQPTKNCRSQHSCKAPKHFLCIAYFETEVKCSEFDAR